MITDYATLSSEYKEVLESEMVRYVKQLQAPSVVKEAMIYSLEAGGKRIRPMLVFAVLSSFGVDVNQGISSCCGY